MQHTDLHTYWLISSFRMMNLIQPSGDSAGPRHAGTGPLVKAELLGTARLAVHRIAGIDLLGLVAPVIGDRLLNGAAALAGYQHRCTGPSTAIRGDLTHQRCAGKWP